ncbi:MAG: substrate-binding domain-containing protein [Burkholderiales bacterium]|nr:substrate-binding domain-containing protein [Flavobacterium sp.]
MKKYINMVCFLTFIFLIIQCQKKEGKSEESILRGITTILVDETLTPIINDQVEIFESRYEAKITVESKSEGEVIQALTMDSSRIAILSRKLNIEELNVFKIRKLIPKMTPFAKDGIALIVNINNKDSLIALEQVVAFMQGKNQSSYKGLVFDNPNSSTSRYFCELAGIKSLPKNNVFSFKTNDEVIRYVSQNDGMIGIVGLNYIFQPTVPMGTYLAGVRVLNVKNDKDNQYYSPTQNNIAEGKYPLARDLYIVNCQGFSGLGMGFASFVAGETGQRIILKSGLVPVRIPSRKILIRKQINNDKK